MIILNVTELADKVKAEIKMEVAKRQEGIGKTPHLAILAVGEDNGVKSAVKTLSDACCLVGFDVSVYNHPVNIKEHDILQVVRFTNTDDEVDAIMLQPPFPVGLAVDKIADELSYEKDITRQSKVNRKHEEGRTPLYIPQVPAAILTLFGHCGVLLEGKTIVYIEKDKEDKLGVGEVLSTHDTLKNSLLHIVAVGEADSKNKMLAADILIVNTGRAESVTATEIKRDAVVIDLGCHKMVAPASEDGFRLVGDIREKGLQGHCRMLASAAGGFHRLCTVMLLQNILLSSSK